nr:transposase [Arthrobacter sp. KBS0703]
MVRLRRIGKPDIDWDDQDAKDGRVSALVTDALALLAAVDPEILDRKAAHAYALLALVAGQDVEPAEDSDGTDGRWRIARKVAPERMISTVDPDTRHAHKTQSRQQDGFKAHIVIEPDTGLITAAELTKASGPENGDGTISARLISLDPTIAGTSVRVQADSAYGSGEMLAALARTAHTPVIKPWPLRPAVEGGFTLDDFTVDEAAGTVTCPHNLTRAITAKRRVTFGAACTGCPFRARCTIHHRDASSFSTNTTRCSANTANAPRIRPSRMTTARTGPWSSGPSPGGPAATAAYPTAASAGQVPGERDQPFMVDVGGELAADRDAF